MQAAAQRLPDMELKMDNIFAFISTAGIFVLVLIAHIRIGGLERKIRNLMPKDTK